MRYVFCSKNALTILNPTCISRRKKACFSHPCSIKEKYLYMNIHIYVFWGSRYLYYFEKGNQQITNAAIQGLIELITTELQTDSPSANPAPAPDAFFTSTLRYIQFQKQKGGVMGERYDSINV